MGALIHLETIQSFDLSAGFAWFHDTWSFLPMYSSRKKRLSEPRDTFCAAFVPLLINAESSLKDPRHLYGGFFLSFIKRYVHRASRKTRLIAPACVSIDEEDATLTILSSLDLLLPPLVFFVLFGSLLSTFVFERPFEWQKDNGCITLEHVLASRTHVCIFYPAIEERFRAKEDRASFLVL